LCLKSGPSLLHFALSSQSAASDHKTK
jgi:hypothetical protein